MNKKNLTKHRDDYNAAKSLDVMHHSSETWITTNEREIKECP